MVTFLKRNIAAVVVAALVLGIGGVAYAAKPDRPSLTDTPAAASPSAAGNPANPDRAGRPGARAGAMGILRRTVHGDLIVRGKDGFQNVTFDRGKVTAVSTSSLTIERPDGQSVTVSLTAGTTYRGISGPSQLQTGKPAVVVSRDGSALVVGQRGGQRNQGQSSSV